MRSVTEIVAELDRELGMLTDDEAFPVIGPDALRAADYIDELIAELAEHGVPAMKGPEPYWLVYPAWFRLESNDKTGLQLLLNGNKLDTVRPSRVAEIVRSTVTDSFDAEQFADLLQRVRQLFRRAGAQTGSIALDDIYEMLALEPAKKATRRKDFTKADFYFSVHRLAESPDPTTSDHQRIHFPPANRSETLFFTRDGSSRKYLMVEFPGGPTE
jgi:hypothetical protein